jgi:VanZ family protein
MRSSSHETKLLIASICAGLTLCTIGAIFGFYLPSMLNSPYDKIVHVIFFFCLTIGLMPLMRELKIPLFSFVILIAFATELAQNWAPHRFPSMMDTVANLIGIVAAGSVLWLIARKTKN